MPFYGFSLYKETMTQTSMTLRAGVLIVLGLILLVLIVRVSELSSKYSIVEGSLAKYLTRDELNAWYFSMVSTNLPTT
jgi:hypothetical protein